ncbi:MAG: hypothetical protein CMQ05_09050 [Gammaproteobacteria bacterium]|uniref:Alpha/beta hydrolase n=1 Tax=OM182 bacterium MED-G24 TaxID=1986255 RepID=A0A2A5WKQ6_9GAMM|nr:hypothetical protein [Gammaproteobacteria bacterium]PDH36873.1 MAG: hypothetical protein CNE99_08895 [OM182 bacterium MED-G24]RPG27241.1 MAG: alpha/beta hydrolase [Gammaproteobacteria bacterium TMED50]|tara:strand:+ start:50003 stop:51124 length:1122 start_codon:yes stop_codon:yes gene_type:complete
MTYENHPLWPDGAPLSNGADAIDTPRITVMRASAERRAQCAVVVVPGGGYRILASDHEGLQVGHWLNRQGIDAFVLRYRLGEKYHSDISLLDGKRAVRWVRAHYHTEDTAEDGRTPVGMLGFSAGGHLTAAVGTGFDEGDGEAIDVVERESCRPDFLVLGYAVTNGQLRGRKADEYTPTDVRVNAHTPPAFIMHTHEDSIVPSDQALVFYTALCQHGVQAELHVFGSGDHGLGLGVGDPDLNLWPDLLVRWLRRNNFVHAAQRWSVNGNISIDGASTGGCWVSLVPDDDTRPFARAYVTHHAGGQFLIPAAMGPQSGPHCVIVSVVSRAMYDAKAEYSMDDVVTYEQRVTITGDTSLDLVLKEADRVAHDAVH